MPYEQDIRAALRARAGQAPDPQRVMTEIRERQTLGASAAHGARPLGLMNYRGRPGRARRRFRVLAVPAAAAAAVVALIVGSLALSGGTHVPRQAAAGARVSLGSVPRYYMRLLQHGHYNIDGRLVQGEEAVIRDTLTGATIATIRPPAPFKTFDAVTGAADDRTFVLSASLAPWAQPKEFPTKFFIARFDPSTRAVTLKALPIPELAQGDLPVGLALSPSGTELAISGYNRPVGYARVSLYSVASGAVRSWLLHGQIGRTPLAYDSLALSWSRSGTLAVNMPDTGTIRLLKTDSAGGSLLAHSRQAVVDRNTGTTRYGDGLLTADGTKIVVPMEHFVVLSNGDVRYDSAFEVFSAASGRLIRLLHKTASGLDGADSLVWTSPSGSVLVGEAQPGTDVFVGVISGSQFIPIPGTSPEVSGFAF